MAMCPRKRQFKRKEIIETAFDMVREGGWDGLSVPALAKAINSSTMPIYSHFKNVRDLEDAVFKKAVDYMYEYMSADRPGDKWINHAVRFVEFAYEEKMLFRCIFDGRNPELQFTEIQRCSQMLLGHLTEYPLFKGLSEEQLRIIRYSRFMLAQGMATSINSGWHTVLKKEELESFLTKASTALAEGLRAQFAAEKNNF